MSDPSINGVRGVGPGSTETRPVASTNSAQMLSHANMREFANSGWISGKIIGTSPDATYLIETKLGELTLRAPRADFEIGSRLMVAYDKLTGKVLYQAFREVLGAAQEAIQPRPAPQTPLSQPPSLPPAIQAAIAAGSLDPVQVSGQVPQTSMSTQALSAVFPHAQSPAFSILISLFPLVVREGALSRLSGAMSDRYGESSRLAKLAREHLLPPVPKVSLENTLLSWQVPFFDHGKALTSRWEYEEQQIERFKDEKRKRVFLEVRFQTYGVVQIEAYLAGQSLSVEIISDQEMPEELINRLRDTIHVLARAWGLVPDIHYGFGR